MTRPDASRVEKAADEDREKPRSRRRYRSPAVRSDRVYERNAVACNKLSDVDPLCTPIEGFMS